jgi:sec-independent protein translocase protein TatA
MIGSQDLMVGLVIVLVLFGAKKLPELAGSIGKSMKEFKKGVSEATEEEPAPKPQPAAPPSPAPAQACGYCNSPLEATWSHCPRCGTATVNSADRSS